MIKQILYACLFVALVVGLAYVLANFLPTDVSHGALFERLEALEKKEPATDLRPYLEALENRLSELEKAWAVVFPPPTSPVLSPSLKTEKALLQTLNCKLLAHSQNTGKLLLELHALEKLLKELAGEDSQLWREVNLARRETAAQIPSAIDRLEIVWTLLLSFSY